MSAISKIGPVGPDNISHHKANNRDHVRPGYAFNDAMAEIMKKSTKPKVEKASGGEVHLHTKRENPLSFLQVDPEEELLELIENRFQKIQKILRNLTKS